jgi:hypothetical protein
LQESTKPAGQGAPIGQPFRCAPSPPVGSVVGQLGSEEILEKLLALNLERAKE